MFDVKFNLNDFFTDSFPTTYPIRVLYQGKSDPSNYYLDLECPGFTISELSLSAEEGCLKITGEHQVDGAPVKTVKETFTIGKDSNLDEISAKYVNGILSVVIPRVAPADAPVRKISISGV